MKQLLANFPRIHSKSFQIYLLPARWWFLRPFYRKMFAKWTKFAATNVPTQWFHRRRKNEFVHHVRQSMRPRILCRICPSVWTLFRWASDTENRCIPFCVRYNAINNNFWLFTLKFPVVNPAIIIWTFLSSEVQLCFDEHTTAAAALINWSHYSGTLQPWPNKVTVPNRKLHFNWQTAEFCTYSHIVILSLHTHTHTLVNSKFNGKVCKNLKFLWFGLQCLCVLFFAVTSSVLVLGLLQKCNQIAASYE